MIDRPGLDTWLARLLHERGLVEAETLQQLIWEVRERRAQGGTTLARSLVSLGVLTAEVVSDCLAEITVRPPALTSAGDPGAPATNRQAGPSWSLGGQVGDYVLEERLGAGGMGEVFLAHHVQTGTKRALKTLHGVADPELVARFRREGAAQAALSGHPNVAQVHSAGSADGRLYLVMEWVDGGTLAQRLAGGPLSAEEAARLTIELARGLSHAHAHGVLHRDLKPDNVMLAQDGTPKLVDFGLARVAWEGSLTQSGAVMGTPAYMAPEQANAQPVDERSDVYGLGAILYHCLTGRPPFTGASVLQLLFQVLEATPASPETISPEVPTPVAAVCMQALAKRPDDRPASAAALGEALQAALAGELGPSRSKAPLAVGLLALALAGIATAALWPTPEPTPQPDLSLWEPASARPPPDLRTAERLFEGGQYQATLDALASFPEGPDRVALEAQCLLLLDRPREALARLEALPTKDGIARSRSLQALAGLAAFRTGAEASARWRTKPGAAQETIVVLEAARKLLAIVHHSQFSQQEFQTIRDKHRVLIPPFKAMQTIVTDGKVLVDRLGRCGVRVGQQLQFAVCEATLAVIQASRGKPELLKPLGLADVCKTARQWAPGPGQRSFDLIPPFRAWVMTNKAPPPTALALADEAGAFPPALEFTAISLALRISNPRNLPQQTQLVERGLRVQPHHPWLSRLVGAFSLPASGLKTRLASSRLLQDPSDPLGIELGQEALRLALTANRERDHVADWLNVAQAHLLLRQFEQAETALRRARTRHESRHRSDNDGLTLLEAELQLAQRKLDLAERTLGSKLLDGYLEAHCQRALLKWLRNDRDGAREHLSKKALLQLRTVRGLKSLKTLLPWRTPAATRAVIERGGWWPGSK